MATGSGTMYLAWGANIDLPSLSDQLKAERRSEAAKAVTTSYVAGPGFKIEETDLVSFGVEVEAKNATATLFFKVQHSYDRITWMDQTAGLAITATGAAPDQEAESEILPFVKKWEIPTAADDQKVFFNYEQRALFTRILVRGDAAGATIRIQAGV